MKVDEKTAARFWAKVDKSPGLGPKGTCWHFRAKHTVTRPGFSVNGKQQRAHRVSYAIEHGELPDNDLNGPFHEINVVMHRCDNSLCVRPDHLELGDHSTNGRHKFFARRDGPLGERNAHAKITPKAVYEIRAKAGTWDGMLKMMKKYRLHQLTVMAIYNRKYWKHLP